MSTCNDTDMSGGMTRVVTQESILLKTVVLTTLRMFSISDTYLGNGDFR